MSAKLFSYGVKFRHVTSGEVVEVTEVDGQKVFQTVSNPDVIYHTIDEDDYIDI